MVSRRRLPPLNPLLAFEVAARCISFTRAAEELCVTQGAISRQVKVLEDYLNVQLFERESSGLRLTQGAEAFAATLTSAFDRINRATDHFQATRNHSTLIVRSYSTLLTRWLVPRLTGFYAKHPEIEVRLVANPDPVNFERDTCDVGIVYSPRMIDVERNFLFSDALMPVCNPTVIEEWNLKSPRDLLDTPALILNARQADWADWLAIAGLKGQPLLRKMYFDDLSIVYECALQGQGVAMGQTAYLQRELADGRLVRPFEPVLRREAGYYLVYPKQRLEFEKVRIFIDWLLGQCARPTTETSSEAPAKIKNTPDLSNAGRARRPRGQANTP